jgi:hypothetical protein
MPESNRPICFQCGQASRVDAFNRLPDGRKCPVCVERLYATLPAVLPSSAKVEEAELATRDYDPDYDGETPAA